MNKMYQKLDNALYRCYYINAIKYKDYRLKVRKPNDGETHVGEYNESKQQITVITQPFMNKELILVTALHELAHHVQYIDTGHVNHSRDFKRVHRELVMAALENKSIDVCKLYLSVTWLSDLLERKDLEIICKRYARQNKISLNHYDVEFSEDEKAGYEYNGYLNLWYRFVLAKND